MNSIESLRLDFNSQIKKLNEIRNKKIFDDCIYVGSGDSYAAGLFAEFFTGHRCRCYSPSDLIGSKILYDKTYCFISVTGKTKANIELAQRATESGARTVAITFDQNSKLAQVCKEVVLLKLPKAKTPGSGFGTFVANVVTSLQLTGVDVPKNFHLWYKKGLELSLELLNSVALPDQITYVIGNNILHVLAFYASLKMAEFFGITAVPYKLEEFCHSPIFGIKKSHYLWILGQSEKRLSRKLGKLGINISYFELYNGDTLTQLFQSIFFVQHLILLLAQRSGFTQLKYLVEQDVLKTSSDIIYNNRN